MPRRWIVVIGVAWVFVARGCASKQEAGPPPPEVPVLLQTYNGVTGEPLGAVAVARWDYDPNRDGEDVFSRPAGSTGGVDGLYHGVIPEWPPSFIFTKIGFEPAEVRVSGDGLYADAYVASPSAGNRWYLTAQGRSIPRKPPGEHVLSWLLPRPLSPIEYEEWVPARPLIRVPMWPRGSGVKKP